MRRIQTLLAVLSVALGVAAFATVTAIDAWQRQQIRALQAEFAPDVLVVRRAAQWPVDVEFVSGQNYGITFDEAMLLGDVPGVVQAAYQGSGGRLLGQALSVQRVPVSESIFEVLGLDFAVGAPFGEEARLLDLPFVVLGATAAIEIFGSAEEALGQVTDLGAGKTVRVEGVLEPVPAGVTEYQYLNAAAMVPGSVSNNFHPLGRPAATQAFVKFAPGEEALARRGVEEVLAGLPVGPVYEVVSAETWLVSQRLFRNRVADELSWGSVWVVLLALLATLGNLMNTLALRAVDRAKSLAVRRAFGATRGRILGEMVLDAIAIGGAGTLLGLALWPLVSRVVNVGQGFYFTSEALWTAGAVGLGVTLVALMVPATWTLRMPIYRSLREELAPPVLEGVALAGMAAGVLALVVATSIASGAERWFRERLVEVGADRVVMTTIGGPSDRRASALSAPPLDEMDVSAIAGVPGVLGVATAVQDPFMAVVVDEGGPEPRVELASVTRVSELFFEVNPKPIEFGRAPVERQEVVIGPLAAEWAYPGVPLDQVVGRDLVLASQSARELGAEEVFTIVGVFADRAWESYGDLFEGAIVRLLRPEDPPMASSTARDVHIKIDLSADHETVLTEIREVVDARHAGFGAAVVHEPVGDVREVRATMHGVSRAWSTMAWISLVVGGVGLASIVIVRLVKSRAELALKRALGATQVRVASVSTVMALRIAGFAAIAGLLAAAGVTVWVTSLAPWQFSWPWREAVVAISTALVVALAAVSLPILAFSRAQPWAVLKEE